MSGGGARAAYQVGVLRAIAAMLPPGAANPFAIICGTSAGAINAASLASNADRFDAGVARLARVWGNLHVSSVYRTDLSSLARSLYRCLVALLGKREHQSRPLSLLDCGPLGSLLCRMIDFRRIQRVIAAGHLNALSVTASSYATGDSVTFFQSDGSHKPWRRAHRVGRPADIGLSHVMAPCALPIVFPTVPIGREHFGDGSMHQLAPISAALHLGARRVLAIGVGSASLGERTARDSDVWPSLAQIAGDHAISSRLDITGVAVGMHEDPFAPHTRRRKRWFGADVLLGANVPDGVLTDPRGATRYSERRARHSWHPNAIDSRSEPDLLCRSLEQTQVAALKF
jgi:NTE family protein